MLLQAIDCFSEGGGVFAVQSQVKRYASKNLYNFLQQKVLCRKFSLLQQEVTSSQENICRNQYVYLYVCVVF